LLFRLLYEGRQPTWSFGVLEIQHCSGDHPNDKDISRLQSATMRTPEMSTYILGLSKINASISFALVDNYLLMTIVSIRKDVTLDDAI